MKNLFLIRHGQTNKNISNALHKKGDEETLNNEGKEQIIKTAAKLKAQRITKIYCSNEIRAMESAKIISEICEVPMETISGFEERNWGDYSGKPWSEVKLILDPMNLDERYLYIPPNGESWKDFETRLNETLTKIKNGHDGDNVCVVTHGGAIRALMPLLLNVPKEESFKYDPKNASITLFELENDKYKPLLIDDITHLNA